jgi:FMN phosphatase YigB (HAD superfamily)
MLFDLWGTLIIDDPDRTESRRLRRVAMAKDALDALGFHYETDVVERAFRAASQEHGRIHAEGLDLSTEGRTVLYLRTLDESLPDRLDDDGWRRMREAILTPAGAVPPLPVPGAADTLAEVKSLGLPTALVSNAGITPGFVLRQFLEQYSLIEHLDVLVFSDEVEIAKPSPAIFSRALDDLGVDDPGDAAFVGDQPVLDVLGPRSAGLWSIQFGDLAEDGIAPHARINTLADLIPTLRHLNLLP